MSGEFARLTQATEGRFVGIERDYSLDQVRALAGSVRLEHSLACIGANRLW